MGPAGNPGCFQFGIDWHNLSGIKRQKGHKTANFGLKKNEALRFDAAVGAFSSEGLQHQQQRAAAQQREAEQHPAYTHTHTPAPFPPASPLRRASPGAPHPPARFALR